MSKEHRSLFFICLFFIVAALLQGGEFRLIDGRDFPKMGMFAAANQVLGQLSIYETKDPVEISGLLVDFSANGLYYDPSRGLNWWNYYFEPICLGSREKRVFAHLDKSGYFQAFRKRRRLTRVQASEIVKKYIHVKKNIIEKVERFVSYYFNDFFIIGIHYRGTDKNTEAPRVSYETVFQAIIECLPQERQWRIFVATDEAQFIKEMEKMFPRSVIACKAHRSETELGIHISCRNSYEIGEEALIDALLLSQCHLLIRTSSNLSLWSTYFNPKLPTILLSNNFRSHENVELE